MDISCPSVGFGVFRSCRRAAGSGVFLAAFAMGADAHVHALDETRTTMPREGGVSTVLRIDGPAAVIDPTFKAHGPAWRQIPAPASTRAAPKSQQINLCPGDLNGDSTVNVSDLLLLLGSFGACPGCAADLNGDDVVNVSDLLLLLGNFGACPPCLAPDCLPPGDDCWVTPCGATQFNFEAHPIPAEFFGPGSEPFEGRVRFGGNGTDSDTVVSRLDELNLPGPDPVSDTIPIEIIQLDLTSCEPITVTFAGEGEPQQWDVHVDLSSIAPSLGEMTVTRTSGAGGLFSSTYDLVPRFTFTNVDDPAQTVVFDMGDPNVPGGALPPVAFAVDSGPWSYSNAFGEAPAGCDAKFAPGVNPNGCLPDDPDCCCPSTCSMANDQVLYGHCALPPGCLSCSAKACCIDTVICANEMTDGECVTFGGLPAVGPPICFEGACADACFDEGEICDDDSNDPVNGGCNSDPPVFTTITCGEERCGTAWAFWNEPDNPGSWIRDTDWYELVLERTTAINFTATAQFPSVIGILNTEGSGNCADITALDPFAIGNPNQQIAVEAELGPGVWWLFVAPLPLDGYTCSNGMNGYDMSLSCEALCVPPECLPAGEDCWTTPCEGGSAVSFLDEPIPADFFDPGSLPFEGEVKFGGDAETSGVDTVVERLGDVHLHGPLPAVGTVPIEIVELNLASCEPIVVMHDDESLSVWDITIGLSPSQPSLGEMTVTKESPEGGMYDSVVDVVLELTFTNQDTGDVRVLDNVVRTLEHVGVPWRYEVDLGAPCDPNFAPGAAIEGEPCCEAYCASDDAGSQHCMVMPECPLCEEPVTCGDAEAGSCFEANGSPACDDADCCELVCAQDAVCCDVEWDAACAALAADVCAAKACAAPECVPAGQDCWAAPCTYASIIGFASDSIPADFFDPGSLPFEGVVELSGAAGSEPGAADVVIERLDDADVSGPLPATATVPIEIVELNLASCHPITVAHTDESQSQWDVAVGLVPSGASLGEMTVTKDAADGGTYDVMFDVVMQLTFTNTMSGEVRLLEPVVRTLDAVGVPWVFEHAESEACGVDFLPGVKAGSDVCCLPYCHNSVDAAVDQACISANGCDLCPPPPKVDPCCLATGAPGCGNAACESQVCAADAFCCDVEWDELCATAAQGMCSVCGACCNAAQGAHSADRTRELLHSPTSGSAARSITP